MGKRCSMVYGELQMTTPTKEQALKVLNEVKKTHGKTDKSIYYFGINGFGI